MFHCSPLATPLDLSPDGRPIAEAAAPQLVADADTPTTGAASSAILTAYRHWQACMVLLNSADHLLTCDATWRRLVEHAHEIVTAAMQMPARAEGDVLAKIVMITSMADEGIPRPDQEPQMWTEIAKVLGDGA